MPDFSSRNTESELMDGPLVGKNELAAVFRDINKSNQMLGGYNITIWGLERLVSEHPQQSYTILDMGCGDGTMLRKVAIWSRGRNFQVNCIGVDLNNNGLALAKSMSQNFPEIRYLKRDILTLEPTDLKCDILISTLTMHHFSNSEIPIFLQQFAHLSHIGVVINDLQRSCLAYYLFKLFSPIFIRTKIAKHDGLVSIASGFTKRELVSFSQNLNTMTHEIQWKWAFRYVWIMRSKRPIKIYE